MPNHLGLINSLTRCTHHFHRSLLVSLISRMTCLVTSYLVGTLGTRQRLLLLGVNPATAPR